MTTEQRLDRLEETDRTLTELNRKLAELKVDTASIAQRQREQMDRGRKMLDEAREDTKRTRRLWARLAAKHGWPDYEDLDRDSW